MKDTAPNKAGGIKFAIDFGPLLLFFLAYRLSGVFLATGVFMLAIALAVLVSRIKLGRVSPMLWLSAILVVGFGGLTLWFHDPTFIQIKPTLVYSLFALIIFGGLALRKPTLKYVFEMGYDDLSDRGWTLLSRNWALFFVGMAVLNEILRRNLSFGEWLTVKVWAVSVLSLLFGLANIPLLMKHGLARSREPETPVPPQG